MIPDYLGGASFERIRIGSNVYVKIYNDTTATILRGEIFIVELFDDVDSLSPSLYPTVAQALTEADKIALFGVALGDILDTETGFMQIEGDCPAVLAEGTIGDEEALEVITATQRATSDGAAKTERSFGVAKGATTVGLLFRAVLYGDEVVIAAT